MGLNISLYKVVNPQVYNERMLGWDTSVDFFLLDYRNWASALSEFEHLFCRRFLDRQYASCEYPQYRNQINFLEKQRVVLCREIGCQRRGENNKFYEDDVRDSPPITKLSTLEEHWEKYFSGYNHQYETDSEENFENFYQNIVSGFKENETFVLYH